MAIHSLVSGLPHVFPSLPPSLGPPCTPCGPAPTLGPERERYFLVVVDDYSRYTTVFPLVKNSEVTSPLIRWLLAVEGTRGSRTLPESPQQNGVAGRHIGLVMEIARTSMIHARAPHFLWPYALCYAAHQLNLQPRVSRPKVSPTCLWTGSPGVGSAFHVWGCLALVRDTSAAKLSARAIPCVFIGFLVGSPNYSFYHPPLHQFLDSRDVRFDDSMSNYTWYSCRGLPWSLRRPLYGLCQSPREWHNTLCSTLRDLGFRPSSADPSLFIRNGSTPFFILVYVDDLVFATADRAALTEVKSEVQKRHKCTDLGDLQRYLSLHITRDRSTRTITLTQSHMVQQELRWLTFLLADLGERPCSATTLYADNKAMILLCREPRLESRVKHIDVRYFLLRELQRHGHARLDFVASEANTADVFIKALAPGDHHKFCVELGLVEVGPRLL
ncbi:unnamed protein product [Closterium sp. NIES-53]